MSSYVKRNVKGKWKSIKVEDGDERDIKRQTFEDNLAVLKLLKKEMPDEKGYTEAERIAMFENLSRHYHYNVENFADEMIEKGSV